MILLWSEGRHSIHKSIHTTVVYLLVEMNVSKPPKNRPKRTGARGGSRTGHKSTNCSKTASTNGSKSSLKQASHKEQQDPSRPRSARTDLLAGEHFIPQELMPGLYLSSKTSTMSSYRLGKSLPVVLNSGHDKILKVTDHVRKLSLKSTTSQQVVTCEGAEGNLNMLSQEDPQPRNFEESKYDDTFPVKEMTGEQNLSRLKETININEGNKKTGVIENKLEYLVTDDNSGLAVMAPQNGNSPKLAASGDYIPGQFAERQRYSTRQSDLSGFSDIYGRATYSETTSIYSGEWTNLDWMDSNSGLISDLCDIVRDSIMESGMKNKERFIKPALTPMMQVLVDRIIKESRNIPIQEWNANARQCPSRSSAASTNSSNGGLSSSPSARSSLVTDGKFAKNERDDELSDDDEEKLPKGPPGPDISSNEAEIGLRLSCPFQKHDPKKYNPPNYRSCASTGWNSISRVK